MKTLPTLLGILLLTAGLASAQTSNRVTSTKGGTYYTPPGSLLVAPTTGPSHDITGFSDKSSPALNGESSNTPPNPNVNLKPKVGGIFADGAEYGTVMISPGAPAEYGMGEKYLSAPSTREDLKHESGQAAHRDTGGLKLFTFEF
jgi:hypothetical protein